MNVNHFSLPTYQDKALYSQAHYFLYNRGSPPFSQFQEPEFKAMLTNMIPTGPGWPVVKKVPILNSRQLMLHVDAEWDLFKMNLRSQLKPLVEQSKGNPFAMLVHDAVTLAKKCQS